MTKKIKYALPLAVALMFSACSKNEVQKEDIEQTLNKQRVQADVCQKLEPLKDKLECYNKIIDTNTFAMLRMGIYNSDAKKDYKEAVKLFNKMIEEGNYYGNLGLAFLYYKGNGVEKDIQKAHDLLIASKDKDANAAYQLSRFYLKGMGNVQKDADKGIELIKSAAQRDLYTAQRQLYRIYKFGLYGVATNEEKANFWKEKYENSNKDTLKTLYKL